MGVDTRSVATQPVATQPVAVSLLDEELETERKYWAQKLAGDWSAAGLPCDYLATGRRAGPFGRLDLGLAPATVSAVRRVCSDNASMTLAFLISAVKVVLAKYTGLEDVVVGTAVHRRFEEAAAFNRILAIRDRVAPTHTVRQVLNAVKNSLSEAFTHQKYPLAKIPEILDRGWANPRSLLRVGVLLDAVNDEEHYREAHSEVVVAFSAGRGGLGAEVEYRRDLFKHSTVATFAAQLEDVLGRMAGAPELEISALRLLSRTRPSKWLVCPRGRSRSPTRGAGQHFEERVAANPEAKAVLSEHGQMTYGELGRLVTGLASVLRDRGVGRGDCVGLCLEPSPEAVAGILAILKAGAAFVPLDPEHPPERRSSAVRGAGIALVVSRSGIDGFETLAGVETLCLDAGWEQELAASPTGGWPELGGADLAYVIHTSGSTGQPKGVAVSHAALANYVEWAMEVYLSGENLDFVLHSSLAFDLTVTSVLTPLAAGRAILVHPWIDGQSPFPRILSERRPSVLKLTPSHLALLTEHRREACGIRRLVVGGEALTSRLARSVHEGFGGQIEIYNEYGPTEATVGCMIHRFEPEEDDRAFVPIGRAGAGARIYLLDGALQPVAENMSGELFLAGPGLAQGYLSRPGTTAQQFVCDPFDRRGGMRMYRTGDYARLLPEGGVDFLGRMDNQVKFHGFRVELNEIRLALIRHPEIRDAAVVVTEEGAGRQVMLGYYVSRQMLDQADLRRHLKRFLIEGTIPNLFVHLRRMPLTLNGKVDTRRLPSLEEARKLLRRRHVAPASETERILAGLWAELLAVDKVGIHDSFFDLGGHSLLVTRLVSRIRVAFRAEVSLQEVFTSPTVSQLAGLIDRGNRAGRRSDLPAMEVVPREGEKPLSFAQQRLWFLDQLEPGNAVYNIPVALRMRGGLDVEALAGSLAEIVWRHETLRTVFSSREGRPIQEISAVARVSLPRVDLSGLIAAAREPEARRIAAIQSLRPFDLARGPLLRLFLLELSPDDHALILTLHHIVSDGWSMEVLTREAMTLYAARSAGRPSPLPELPIQYLDFGHWQRRWLAGQGIAADLEYWKKRLEGAPATLELTADFPRGAVQRYRGASSTRVLSTALSDRLREFSRIRGATLFMTLMSAFKALLLRYTGQQDICVGTPVSGRDRIELEGLIGFFVNTLVLRSIIAEVTSFEALVDHVRREALNGFAHQSLPFERLVEELSPRRSLSHSPLFQVMFLFASSPLREAEAQVPGLRIEPLDVAARTEKFDLTLAAAERKGRVALELGYRIDLFAATTTKRMLGHLEALVVAALSEPDRPIMELPLLSPAQRHALIVERFSGYTLPVASMIAERRPIATTPLAEERRPRTAAGLVAPRNPTEEAMAALWREVLELDELGVDDDFFMLGGHSLLATQLLDRVERRFHARLPLRVFFQASTVAGLAEEILREKALEIEPVVPEALPRVEPDPARRFEPFPLNDVQQAYWIGRQAAFELGNVATHSYLEIEAQGVEMASLESILNRLVAGHEMLRMVVLADGTQRILEHVPAYEIEVRDLRRMRTEERERELARMRSTLSHQVLATDRWPLFEVKASLLPQGRARVHLSCDALIWDAWSFRILARDYARLAADPTLRLQPPDLSFRDYVLAERQLEGSALYRRSRDYWMARLAGLPPAPELPLARAPESVERPRFLRRSASLAAPAWKRLKQRAAPCGLTSSALILAAFSEVLATWSRNPRFTLNLTLFNRLPIHPEVDSIVGDFTSLTLLEVDLRQGARFEERARAIQARLWEDLDHRYFSGVRVLRELARLEGRAPGALMPVVVTSTLTMPAVATPDRPGDERRGASGESVYSVSQTPQVWLDHQVWEQEGALRFNWDAVEELFPAGLLDAMLTAYRDLLESLAEDDLAWRASRPDLAGRMVPADAPWARVHGGAIPHAAGSGRLHEPVLAQAAVNRDRTAVVAPLRGGMEPFTELSYGELERRARILSARLRRAGAAAERPVAVVMDKGWEQVVAVLAILDSGAPYLPIDPALPRRRRAELMASAEVSVAVTQPWLAKSPEWPTAVSPLVVTEEGDQDPSSFQEPVRREPGGSGELAYVIFTSGSTGRPKGVMIEHGAALNTVLDVNERFRIGPGDRVLDLSSLSFDLSVYDVFGLLSAGGAVVLPEGAALRDPGHWAELIAARRVTVWNTVPALMEMLIEWADGRHDVDLSSLRLVLLSGDWIPVDLPDRIRAVCPRAEVVSLGGATEASIWSILYPIGKVEASWNSVPYGRAMRHQEFHVLDAFLAPRPVWVIGELFIGGVGLARGYWRDAAKTARSFVASPSGRRLYRTGDLGRFLPDGTIEFLGREDHQVKIQGHRIELGEVEAALESHPDVRSAAVVAMGPERSRRRLVAYLVPRDEPAPADSDLRSYLARRLPEYMVPATFVALATLPLTPNGKIDRRALPAPEEAAPKTRRDAGPTTPVERELTVIWQEILGRERVGAHESLFDLGGNSLAAIQLVNRVSETFGVDVPLRRLFQAPTVAGLAAAVDQMRAEQERSASLPAALPTIEPDRARRFEPFSLNEVQQAYWIGRGDAFELGNVASHGYMEIQSASLDLQRLEGAWQRLIERHDMLRAVVLADGRQRVLRDVPPYRIAVADLRGEPPAVVASELEAIRERMSHQVLPADRWPLFELRATRLEEGVRLHVSSDILLIDAWSSLILYRELMRLYQDPDAELPPLDVTFRDYVAAEAAFRDSPPYERSRRYWLDRLESLPPAPELPLARRPGTLTRPRFSRRRAVLERGRWSRLKKRAADAGLTPSGLLLAAFADGLATWSKSAEMTINVTTFNRLPLHPQVNEVVGDFTSLTLLQVDARGGKTFERFARTVQEQLWLDLEHRYFNGVSVLREWARARGRTASATMPVVFTSTLFHGEEPSQTGGPAAVGASEETVSAGQDGRSVYGISQTPQVWLDHQVSEGPEGLHFNWDAIEDLFPDGLLDAMFAAFHDLLLRLADQESTWSLRRPARVPEEQLAVLDQANATAAPAPRHLLQTPFMLRAARSPEDLAVLADGVRLSYGELARRARCLAERLRGLGVGPSRLVAVVMEKGWEQVVAVLGILEAGAAYLPIDARVPDERRQFLLENGRISVAVTQGGLTRELAWPPGVELVAVTADDPAAGTAQGSGAPPACGPRDLAYVIFTSGSTGKPKGVMIDHRGALNTVHDVNERFGIGPADRVLGLSSLSFDLSVYDVFGLLAAGGALVLPEPAAARDPERWAELIASHGVTVWNTVPALMEMLVEWASRSPGADLTSLRRVLLSGDWIPVDLPDRIRRLCPNAEVVSLGGATEASIWSILYPVREVPPSWTSIPYGRPMRNQRFHVLDQDLRTRPVWVPGELYIGGDGLALGYWRDAPTTASRFVAEPRSGERLYRTGDLGRYLPDGTIEFLGREDLQVKIQGHRIELGEVEAALEAHPLVRSAVVTAVGTRSRQRLAAYLVPEFAESRDSATAPDAASCASRLGPRGPGPGSSAAAPAASPVGPLDALGSLDFKLSEPGLRRDLDDRQGLQLLQLDADETLARGFGTRRSHREFLGETVPFSALSRLMGALGQVRLGDFPLPKYRYPSAGNLYPVQTYLYVKPAAVEDAPAGLYYHHARDHQLVLLQAGESVDRSLYGVHNQPIFDQAAFALFLIGDLRAIRPLYGESARDFCLLEAGYMSQLLMSEASGLGLGLCPIGDLAFEDLRGRLVLGDDHVLLHSHVGGRVAASAQSPRVRYPSPTFVVRAPGAGQTAEEAEAPLVSGSVDRAAWIGGVREFLRRKLPEHMVPALFVPLEKLPLSANGKVDRGALPTPDQLGQDRRETAVAPRTAVERTLARIWSEVLGVDEIGVHDNFFEMGGDSIKGILFITRAAEAGLTVSTRHVFEHQTIAALAARLCEQGQADQGTTLGPVPLAPAQVALLEEQTAPERAAHALWLEERRPHEAAAISRAVMELARRHDALRLRIERLVSGFWQVASSSRNGCPFAEIDVSSVPDGRWSGLLAAIEAQARVGFDVTRGPLLRVARVKSPADRPSRLLLVVHRLAADAASWPVLLAELDRVCRPPDTPPASPPRAAPISFRRWAEQVSRHSPSAELPESAHREASTPFLLVDHPERRSRTRGVTLRTISTHLSTELTSTLLCRVAETLRAEIEEVLLAAVLRVLARRSATPALRVDVEGSRSRRFLDLPDTTATIGPFGNVFPLRMELGADTSPTEALRRVKQRLRSLEGDGLLYGQLRYLRPQTETATRLRAEPPADVLVGFLGNLDVPGGDSAGWLAAVADGVQVLGPRGLYNRPLEVTGCVLAGRLRVDWTYNGLLFRRGTIESLAREGVAALGELIEEGAAGGSAYAPAEFSEADLSHDELERLVEEFAEADFDEEDE